MFEAKSKIILTGYRATGKSTVGKVLAAHLGLDFLDMDALLAERAGGAISEIVAAHGWDHFRNLERDLLAELIDLQKVVISTGGGAILHQDIWRRLRQTALVVWLQADIDTICRRLQGDAASVSQRPSLTEEEDLFTEVARVLSEREPYYAKGSHLAIDTSELNAQDIIARIEATLQDESLLQKIEGDIPKEQIYC